VDDITARCLSLMTQQRTALQTRTHASPDICTLRALVHVESQAREPFKLVSELSWSKSFFATSSQPQSLDPAVDCRNDRRKPAHPYKAEPACGPAPKIDPPSHYNRFPQLPTTTCDTFNLLLAHPHENTAVVAASFRCALPSQSLHAPIRSRHSTVLQRRYGL
jgi:hypothetical protein